MITTAANVNDVTQALALVDGIPPVAGRPSRPRRRPHALLGDKGYDSNPNRRELRKRRILPVISRKDAPNIQGLGKLRYVVEHHLRSGPDCRPGPLVPDADRFRVLLDGPLVRTLERQPPPLEVLAHPGFGEADPVQLEDQLAYQGTRPQLTRKPQVAGV